MSKSVYNLLSQLNIGLDTLNRELLHIKYSRVNDNSILSDLDYDFLVSYFQMRNERILDNKELDNYREHLERKATREGFLLDAVKKATWKALNTQQQIQLLFMREPFRSQKMNRLYLAFDARTMSFNETALGETVNQLLRIDDLKRPSISIDDVTDSYDFFLNRFLIKDKSIEQMGDIERSFYYKWIISYGQKYESYQYLFPNASWMAFSEEKFAQVFNWYKSWRLKSQEEIEHEEKEAFHKIHNKHRPTIIKRCPDEETAIMSALKHGYGDVYGF